MNSVISGIVRPLSLGLVACGMQQFGNSDDKIGQAVAGSQARRPVARRSAHDRYTARPAKTRQPMRLYNRDGSRPLLCSSFLASTHLFANAGPNL